MFVADNDNDVVCLLVSLFLAPSPITFTSLANSNYSPDLLTIEGNEEDSRGTNITSALSFIEITSSSCDGSSGQGGNVDGGPAAICRFCCCCCCGVGVAVEIRS